MARLPDRVRALFDGKNFAVLSTLEPDGRPHSTVVWVKRDGDDMLLALPKSRRKDRQHASRPADDRGDLRYRKPL